MKKGHAAFTALLFLIVIFLTACKPTANANSENANKPGELPKDAAHQVAEAEDDFQTDGDDYRAEARQAAIDLVKTQLSTWSIKGIASHDYKGQVYDVDVEIERGGKRLVVGFFVQKFFPEAGEPYWRARLERGTLERRLEQIEDDDVLKKLNDAKDRINELEKDLKSEDSQREDE